MNPVATFYMQNNNIIKVELLPELAPNTVNSFIYLAELGVYNGFAIERIVPGCWIDFSYTAFGREEAKYFIDNEAKLQNNMMINHGMMCMGGYGDNEIAGGEVFFPLRECDELVGRFPVLGRIIEGSQLLKEYEKVETYPVKIASLPGVEINTPKEDITIEKVTIEYHGKNYPAPITKKPIEIPEKWDKKG